MIRKLNFKFFIILHWYSRNSKICIRVLYMKQTWNSLSKLSIWMKLCDFTNSNWWIKLSGIRWSKMMIFSISQLWLNNILILRLQDIFFNFQRIFAWTFLIVHCGKPVFSNWKNLLLYASVPFASVYFSNSSTLRL